MNTRIVGLLVACALVTASAAFVLSDLHMDGDIYGLLGHDDPVVVRFDTLAEVTPGLEELLIVCAPDQLLGQGTLMQLTAVDGIVAHTRTYFEPGKSTVQGFSLDVDPADWRETRPILAAVGEILARAPESCGLTGTPAVVQEMQSRVNADLRVALAIAAVLVSLLFAFVYRIGFLALLMLVPVAVGISWGLAAYTLLRGQLTLLAATVPTLLIGIGIDHCIHMIQSCRYSMAQDKLHRTDAVLLAWRRLLPPITLASLTTAATFLTLTAASLRGLADLGWSGALVTLGVYAACISLLPAILLLTPEKWLTRRAVFDRPIRMLAHTLRKRAGPLAALFLVLSVVSFAGITRLEAIDDNRLLESGDLPSLELLDRIALEHGLSSSPILLQFANADDGIELLAEPDRPGTIGSLLNVREVPGLVQVHPLDDVFLRKNFQAVETTLADWIGSLRLGDYELSGEPVVNERINELVYRDVRVVLPGAVIAILAVLAIGTRSLLRPWLALLPLSLALLWLLGFMGLAGIAASVVTVAITPLVLGIGVDGGVHLLSSWDRHEGSLQEVLGETGLAIVITAATSVVAFSAFLFAKSPSLVYFGAQASFALIGCLCVTLALLPYLFRVLLPYRSES